MLNYKYFGENIKKYRKRAGLTQEQLAEIVNCSCSHIGQVENGRGVPSLEITLSIANALGVMIDQLIVLDSHSPELIYLIEIENRIKNYPIKTRLTACEMIQDLLKIIESTLEE